MNIPRKGTLKHCSDEQLLALVSDRGAGSQSAFAVLTERHHGYLYQRCLQKLERAVDVEDVIQEVHFNIYRYAGTFRRESTFKTWLTRIADNQCNTCLRKQENYYLTGHISNLIELHEANMGVTANAEKTSELQRDIFILMEALPQSQKQVLSLRYWEDLSVQEIAQTLGIGLSAAKMRIQRAVSRCSENYFNSDRKVA